MPIQACHRFPFDHPGCHGPIKDTILVGIDINQQAASLQSSCRFLLLVCHYFEGIFKLQVEQLAESQRQEWTAAAAEYERKVIKVSGELRSAMDAADRSASYSCNFSARDQSKVLSADHPLRV